ncbi:hypothetical protein GZH53_04480 [Flavihumibacter sp. R14]|nr:hypothetical protein [Flavihumibacter soli]
METQFTLKGVTANIHYVYKMRVALFGIHKLLSDSLTELEDKGIFPEVVIFPPFDSPYHRLASQICERNKIKYIRPSSVKEGSFIDELRDCSIDRIIVTGYHQIFPKSLLELAGMGTINCHGGLLPEERGPIPWKWAVYEDKPFTGITIHQMTERVDEGKVFFRKIIPIDSEETSESLFNKIAQETARIIPCFFDENYADDYEEQDGNVSKSGYRGQVPVELCEFDLEQTALELQRRVRAFSPRPGVYLERKGRRILVKDVSILTDPSMEGEWILKCSDQNILVTEFEIAKQE